MPLSRKSRILRVTKLARKALTLRGKRLVVLGIPDRYQYRDPELVRLVHQKALAHLSLGGAAPPA
jgi:predicted protein tyrosine phosphatase